MKLWLINICVLMNGCSVYSTMKAPDPVEYKKLTIGTPRHSVVDALGTPTQTSQKS